ncbi:MAG TPA: hypothetical protein DCF33_09415 [Saprospirales bacterium]|nr:hypothetical protein [Saprospirales bacterium]
MKNLFASHLLKNLTALAAVLFLLVSAPACKKDKNDDTYFRFKVNGAQFEATGLLAYGVNFSGERSFYGVKDQSGTESCYINVPSDVTPGTYTLGDGAYDAYYIDNTNKAFSTNWGDSEGTVTIEEINADRAKGTFQFVAYDSDTETIKKTITEGEFNVLFR